MRSIYFLVIITLYLGTYGQDTFKSKKGQMIFSWGYNRSWYSKSDIQFEGDGYKFTLQDVKARDRQSPLNWDPYFKINQLTIPQYNIRLGYFLNDRYSLTIGWDHMKYVMVQDQTSSINGTIQEVDSSYNGVYYDQDLILSSDFLTFEHTDGLNYANLELRRYDTLQNKKLIDLYFVSGVGGGLLYPRTNVRLMNLGRADQWHLSGFGASMVSGINLTFYDKYFIQTEMKLGYIHMSDILTTYRESDRAQQRFFFSQWNVVFGIRLLQSK